MSTAVVSRAPERSYRQRMDALARANEIRSRRAVLKREVKAGRWLVEELLVSPPWWLESMRVADLLFAAPGFGRVRVQKALRRAAVSPSRTVGGLTGRQRLELRVRVSGSGLREGAR